MDNTKSKKNMEAKKSTDTGAKKSPDTNTKKAAKKKQEEVPQNVRLGDGVADAAKAAANRRGQDIAERAVDFVFDYIEEKAGDIPDAIKNLLKKPETRKEISTLWSKHLYEQGVIPKGYVGLSDDLILQNYKQDGYQMGLHVGYLNALADMADRNMPRDVIIEMYKGIGSKVGRRYIWESRELCDQLRGKIKDYLDTSESEETDD